MLTLQNSFTLGFNNGLAETVQVLRFSTASLSRVFPLALQFNSDITEAVADGFEELVSTHYT